jgi:putative transposase
MDGCAQKYKGFCNKYKPKQKTPKKSHWGSRLLGGITLNFEKRSSQKTKKSSTSFDFPPCQVTEKLEVAKVVSQFVEANRPPKQEGKDF